MPPKLTAPGLTWKPRANGWEARWQALNSAVRAGYTIKSKSIWAGVEPTDTERAYIQDQCQSLQSEMNVFMRGGIPEVDMPVDKLVELIRRYQTDADSPFRKIRYRSRQYYGSLCKRLEQDLGEHSLSEIKARHIIHWHEGIADDHVAMAHSCVRMLRILMNFGATILEDEECERLAGALSKMRFLMPKPRSSVLTAEQACRVRAEACKLGLRSLAIAQAFQFDLMLRQKDVIGEWVPLSEPGLSDVLDGRNKWLRGIRWEEIDSNMVLKHVTSKRQKEITVNLKLAPMVMQELESYSELPKRGPVIVSDISGKPWHTTEFRRQWRAAADRAGIPRSVRNMDSRAGAITEATEAGADLEHIKQAATHSDISMTQRYARGGDEKTAGVMRLRAEHRKKEK